MKAPEALCSNPSQLRYVRGWCYQDQLGGLETEAPHILPKPESYPQGVENIYEQEITRAGFIPIVDHSAAYLYRAHPGPSWTKDGVSKLTSSDVAPRWITGKHESPRTQTTLPRRYSPLPSSTQDPIAGLTTLFFNSDVACGVTTGSAPMPYFLRNADGDDLYFVHEGNGVVETELGLIGYEKGHFIFVPQGIAYRIVPQSESHVLFHMENYGEKFQKPETGFTGDAAVFYHRNIEVPVSHFALNSGEYSVVVKATGSFTEYKQTHHPLDVVGWDGDLFPFRLHIRDIQPITSWKSHVPPSAYCTFFGNGFELCSFVPRPVETGDRSLPVPFDHINVHRDEVIFYSSGVFFSKKESAEGSLTFHPRGVSHGPHPSALKRVWEKREKEGAFMLEGYFLLLETNAPLHFTEFAEEIEDKNYINSWQA